MAGEDAQKTQPATQPTATAQPQPATAAVAVAAPAVQVHTPTPPAAAYTQWATQIPIDPALQQQSQHAQHTTTNAAAAAVAAYQHYQAYAQHYPQYAAHYQYHQQIAQQQQAAQQQQQQQQQRQTATAQPQAQAATTTVTQTPVQPVVQTQPPVVAQSQTQTQAHIPTATAATTAATTAGGIDTSDIATLNDALGSAGVDLRAEEESLHRSLPDPHLPYRHTEDRTRKQPPKPAFNTQHLLTTMKTHASAHKITRIPDDSVSYLALALRARLQDLLTGMIHAAQHRTDAQFDRRPSAYEDGTPMWSIVVRKDVAKQLEALERVEREEELRVRRERKERAEMAAKQAAALAQAGPLVGDVKPEGEDIEGGVKKKRKKEMGPGVTAKNMSEDVRKKMSNAVATQAAGLGGRYAWMTSASAAATPKPKLKAETPAPSLSGTNAVAATPSSWARPYVSKKTTLSGEKDKDKVEGEKKEEEEEEGKTKVTVTMRDAMFVISGERGHGGGRGAARGWV